MDELSDIEARRDANVANLRRAFAGTAPGEPPADFAALLRRLASKAGSGSPPQPWAHPRAET